MAIDWSNAYKGNPLSDVARTYLMMSSPVMPPGTPDISEILSPYTKWFSYWTYISEYMKLSNARYEDIDAWILPVAAAKLKDKLPGDEKRLMDIINKRLER